MAFTKQIRFDLDEKLYKRINEEAGENKSEFIRQAIEEKLSKRKTEQLGLQKMVRQIERMDPMAMHGSISDLVFTSQVLFEETKKQNEVLKLLLKRANLAYTFAYQTWEAENDETEGTEWVNAIESDTDQEIKDLKI